MKIIQTLCFVLVLTTVQSAKSGETHPDLYSPEDDVQVLSIADFKSNVENSSRAWLVKFYASWCGNCQRFAPKWKALATDIFSWKDLVQVGVLACSDEINTPICQEYEIEATPNVKYFRENYQTGPQDLGVHIEVTGKSVEALRHHIIDTMMGEIRHGRGGMYPNLLPYTHSDVSKLFGTEKDSVRYVFLVVEPSDSYLGAEIALDLHKTPGVSIRYAFNSNSNLTKSLPIDKFPGLVVVDRNQNLEAVSDETNSRKELKKAIRRFLTLKGVAVVEDVPQKKNSTKNIELDPKKVARSSLRAHVKKMGDVVFQMDLETAVRYSLKQEVSNTKTIQGDKLKALVAYIEVLKKYFPFSQRASTFLFDLTNYVSNSTQIEGWKIGEIVKRAERMRVFSSPQRFLGCEGSKSRYRGYPCSLWKLFHFLTVNSAEDQPKEVLDAMHGYIKHFYGCAACSQHFQEMASRRNISSVSSQDVAILWLWEAHNEVNERLAGDVTEDPEFPKRQFPWWKDCPSCVHPDSSWNAEEVLKYLKKMYGRFNVRYIGSDTKILFPGLE